MRLYQVLWSAKKIVKSPYKMAEIPPIPLAQYFLERLSVWDQDDTAIIDGTTGELTSRAEFRNQILRVSTAFQARTKPNDVVAVSLPNSPQYLLPVLGAIHAGARVSLLNPIYTEEETRHALSLTNPRTVITSAQSLHNIQAVKTSSVDEVVVVGHVPELNSDSVTNFSSLLSESPADAFGVVPDNLDSTAMMPFSSGTTGMPKSVCLSHRNVVSHLIQTQHIQFDGVSPGQNLLLLLPMFHMYGMVMSLTTLVRGGVITTLPKFQLDLFLNAIQQFTIHHLPIVPPIATALAKHPMVDNFDLSSVSHIVSAAAPLSYEIQKELAERLKVPSISNLYGMSEIVAGAIVPHPDTVSDVSRKGSIGQVLNGMEARVVDLETGDDLGPGEEGEIVLRGPNVMTTGYLGNAGATAATVDKEGWIHTGDVGKYDEVGDFFITDRIKELIKVKGFQVAPAELEAMILTLDGVADVAVIGVPVGDGEVPRAYVVKKDGEDVKEEDILSYVASKLATYKQIKGGVIFCESLPRSASGKLLRKELRKLN